jgi:hypothetical protein
MHTVVGYTNEPYNNEHTSDATAQLIRAYNGEGV